jgi:hypothetical protein
MLRIFILVLCCMSFPDLANSYLSQTAQTDGKASSLSTSLEKDLFKWGEKAYVEKRWEDAYQYFKEAFNKRKMATHKKYSPLFDEVRNQRANEEAAKGKEALSRSVLDICETQIQFAKTYATTDKVSSLETEFNGRISELKSKFAAARSKASENEFRQSIDILNSLQPFEKYVPGIEAEITSINRRWIDDLAARGWDLCAKREWREAQKLFQEVQARDTANERAKSGLERANRGIMADDKAKLAQGKMDKGFFREALYLIDEAIQEDPESKEVLQRQKNPIVWAWISKLKESVPLDPKEMDGFIKSRDAFNALDTLRELQLDHPLVVEKLTEYSKIYGEHAWNRAEELSNRSDMLRAATAYTLLYSARKYYGESVGPEKLPDYATTFNKERVTQIVVSVENSCGAPIDFINAIQTRAITALQKLPFPDLWVRTKQAYDAAPGEDTQFQGLRPNGNSYTALLSIEVLRHQSERKIKETVEASDFKERMETIDNPDHLKKKEEVDKEVIRIQAGKGSAKDKQLRIDAIKEGLNKIPSKIERPVIKPYNYMVYDYTQNTEVTLSINLKDRLANTFISSGEEIKTLRSDSGREVKNVQPGDWHNKQNQDLKIASKEEALTEVERNVNESLGLKLAGFVDSYLKRFLQEGKNKMEQRQMEEAVEFLLCHWAFVRGNIADSADARLISDLVRQETGFDIERNKKEFFSKYIGPIEP